MKMKTREVAGCDRGTCCLGFLVLASLILQERWREVKTGEVFVLVFSLLYSVVVFLIGTDSSIVFVCWACQMRSQGADAFCLWEMNEFIGKGRRNT
jgi:hypothetical protein